MEWPTPMTAADGASGGMPWTSPARSIASARPTAAASTPATAWGVSDQPSSGASEPPVPGWSTRTTRKPRSLANPAKL